MFFSKNNIKSAIITGPTGAVGVALINELIRKGIVVYCVCHKASTRLNNIPNNSLVHVVFCDMNEYSQLPNMIGERVDAFFHFAWNGTYGASRNDDVAQIKNIEYTMEAVKVAKKLSCKVFVGAGSQSEFGPTNEIKHPYDYCNPDNLYGAAKLSAMKMGKVLAKQFNIRFIWCRIFSLFGPCDGPYTMVMSSITKMLNGEVCKFTKGDQIWDYIYSKDAAKAFRLVAESGKDGSIYCFASGQTRRLKEFIESMHSIVNPKSEIQLGAIPYYDHQAMNLTADISNLKEDTGFEPMFSFEAGIRDLVFEMNKKKQ